MLQSFYQWDSTPADPRDNQYEWQRTQESRKWHRDDPEPIEHAEHKYSHCDNPERPTKLLRPGGKCPRVQPISHSEWKIDSPIRHGLFQDGYGCIPGPVRRDKTQNSGVNYIHQEQLIQANQANHNEGRSPDQSDENRGDSIIKRQEGNKMVRETYEKVPQDISPRITAASLKIIE